MTVRTNGDIPKYPAILLLGEEPPRTTVEAALRIAQERGVDLVEIDATSSPPKCKLLDLAHFKRAGRQTRALASLRSFVVLTDHPDPAQQFCVPELDAVVDGVVADLLVLGPDAPHAQRLSAFRRAVAELARVGAPVERHLAELRAHFSAIAEAADLDRLEVERVLAESALRI